MVEIAHCMKNDFEQQIEVIPSGPRQGARWNVGKYTCAISAAVRGEDWRDISFTELIIFAIIPAGASTRFIPKPTRGAVPPAVLFPHADQWYRRDVDGVSATL